MINKISEMTSKNLFKNIVHYNDIKFTTDRSKSEPLPLLIKNLQYVRHYLRFNYNYLLE